MSSSSEKYRRWLQRKEGERDLLTKQIERTEGALERQQTLQDDLIKARWLFSEAAKMTQMKVKDHMESLVTMAIQAVFYEDDYSFVVEFEIKRNKPECLLMVKEGDMEPFIPKEDQGGGMIDVVSFALRVVMWSMEKPRSRPLFYLDEPGTGIGEDGGLLRLFGQMVSQISRELGLQIIINTHEEVLAEMADRQFMMKRVNGVSTVEQVGVEQETAPKKKKRKRLGK